MLAGGESVVAVGEGVERGLWAWRVVCDELRGAATSSLA